MEQLNLAMLPQLAYNPEHFLLHAGVRSVFEDCMALVARSSYAAAYVVGTPRAGKTHLTIALVSELSRRGYSPRLVDGKALHAFIAEEATTKFRSDEVLVVDDAHQYMGTLKPGASGPFVDLIERLRGAHSHVILISSLKRDSFECDAHVLSRLAEATALSIAEPDENSVPELLYRMARQRGIQLTERKVEFVERRIPRTLAAIEDYLEKVVHLSAVLGQKVSLTLLGDAL